MLYPRERSSGVHRDNSVCLSVVSRTYIKISICLDLWPQYRNYILPWTWVWKGHLCSLTKTKSYQILAYECITLRQHVVYILDICMTFDPYVGVGGILSEFYSQFISFFVKFFGYLLKLNIKKRYFHEMG